LVEEELFLFIAAAITDAEPLVKDRPKACRNMGIR